MEEEREREHERREGTTWCSHELDRSAGGPISPSSARERASAVQMTLVAIYYFN